MNPELAPTHWSLAHRVGFRFVCAHLLLYFAPVPGTAWLPLAKLLARHLFHMELTYTQNGSGDTTYDYLRVLLIALTALLATIIWSVLDRRRPNYHRLHGFVHAYLRYFIGLILMSYGLAKVFQSQFPFPSLHNLAQSYGDSSPMNLLWTFMGYSGPYNVFAGMAEVIPAMLLFYRRTATLGALIGAGVMANIVALNFCYDVPVKQFSTHLFLTCLFLALPDAGRLYRLFLSGKPVAERVFVPLLPWPRVIFGWQFVKVIALCLFFGFGIKSFMDGAPAKPKPPLQGVYRVVKMTLNDKHIDPKYVDPYIWREIVFGAPYRQSKEAGLMTIRTYGALQGGVYSLNFNLEGNEIKTNSGNIKYTPLPDGSIQLENEAYRATFIKVPEYLLVNRGFHWINEFPFNR